MMTSTTATSSAARRTRAPVSDERVRDGAQMINDRYCSLVRLCATLKIETLKKFAVPARDAMLSHLERWLQRDTRQYASDDQRRVVAGAPAFAAPRVRSEDDIEYFGRDYNDNDNDDNDDDLRARSTRRRRGERPTEHSKNKNL